MVNVNDRRTAILWAVAAFALLLMSMVLLLNGNARSAAPVFMPVPAEQSRAALTLLGDDNEINPFAFTAPNVQCTLDYTTTDASPYNTTSFVAAATVAPYTKQALVIGNVGDVITPNEDYYRLDNAEIDYKYVVQAKPDKTTNYNLGIIVYDNTFTPIITDTDTSNYTAIVTLPAKNAGPYFFKVFQISEQCTGDTYTLLFSTSVPTATPTATSTPTPTPVQSAIPTPQPTWVTGFDVYEPNYDFEHATTVASGLDLKANFVPWGGASVDNDYYRIRVKPGLQVTCETKNLDPGVDPRMALYSGRGEQYFVVANDDVALGDFNSRVSYFSMFEGYIYLLVGQGSRMDLRDTVNSDYTFSCVFSIPGTSTPAPAKDSTPTYATSTPHPPISPVATPTPVPAQRTVNFRIVERPPAVTATTEPTGYRNFRVVTYYDSNQDGLLGAGEGIAGIFVLVLSPDGNTELTRGYTDAQGQISFTVSTLGTVRVVVPLMGVDQMVESTKPEVMLRIVPPALPSTLP